MSMRHRANSTVAMYGEGSHVQGLGSVEEAAPETGEPLAQKARAWSMNDLACHTLGRNLESEELHLNPVICCRPVNTFERLAA